MDFVLLIQIKKDVYSLHTRTPLFEKGARSTTRLIRSLLILLLLLCGAPVHAKVLGSFTARTNYLWRGVTQTDDKPAVSAAIETHADQGSYLGIWSSNTNYGGRASCEVNAYLGHPFQLSKATIDLAIRHYYFPSGGKYSYDFQPDKWANKDSSSFTELQMGVTLAGWNVGFAFSDSYLDSGYSGYYAELNYTHLIMDDLSVTLHIGSQKSKAIDDLPQEKVSDHGVTLKWRDFFLSASNMSDNEDGRQSDRIRYILGWGIVIGD